MLTIPQLEIITERHAQNLRVEYKVRLHFLSYASNDAAAIMLLNYWDRFIRKV